MAKDTARNAVNAGVEGLDDADAAIARLTKEVKTLFDPANQCLDFFSGSKVTKSASAAARPLYSAADFSQLG